MSNKRKTLQLVAIAAMVAISITAAPYMQFSGPVQNASAADGSPTLVDDFESGDLSKWSVEGSGSEFSVTTGSAYEGTYGLDSGQPPSNEVDIITTPISDGTTHSVSYWVTNTGTDTNIDGQISLEDSADTVMKRYGFVSGNLEDLDTGNVLISNPPVGEYFRVEITNIDYSAETFDIAAYRKDGTLIDETTGVAFKSSISDVEAFEIATYGDDPNDFYMDNIVTNGYEFAPDIAGTVETDNGAALSNATAKAYAVDYASLSGTIEEKRERAEEIRQLARNVEPNTWEPQKTKSPDEIFNGARLDGKYAAVHSPNDWGAPGLTFYDLTTRGVYEGTVRFPELGFDSDGGPYAGTNYAPAGEPLVLSIWDPADEELIEDTADNDLPGATENGTIVIEQLAAGPNTVIDTRTVTTDDAELSFPTGKTHKTATVTLEPGFYRVYPEDREASAYILPVGDVDSIIGNYRANLENQAGSLTDRANDLQQLTSNGTVRVQTATTNSTGYFEMSFSNPTVNSTDIVAYKGPDGLTTDPQNLTQQDVTEYFNQEAAAGNIEDPLDVGSVYVTDEPQSADIGNRNLTIETRELSAPRFAEQNTTEQLRDAYQQYFADQSWTSLDAIQEEYLQNASREELEAIYNTTVDVSTGEDGELHDWMNLTSTEENLVIITDDPTTLDRSELVGAIAILQQEIETRPSPIEEPETSPLPGANQSVIGAEFEFPFELTEDDVQVIAEYTNGTNRIVSDEYITVEPANIGGIGDATVVRIEDYPAPDNSTAGVNFRVKVANDQGPGEGNLPVENPTFTGTIESLRYIDFSTLSPAAGEEVTIDIQPEDGDPAALKDITLTGPDGTGQSATVSGNRGVVTPPATPGEATVEVTYASGDGYNITESLDIETLRADIDEPASVRAQKGFGGTFAVTGAGLEGGEVSTDAANSRTTMLAEVGPGEDPPTVVHAHAETIDQPPRATTCTQLARQPDSETIRQRTGVVTHVSPLSEDNYVYRLDDGDRQPIETDGNRYGSVTNTENGTTINSYTDSEGRLCIRTIENPTLLDDARWQVETLLESIPQSPLTIAPTEALP